jgi:hypothetical protein
MTSMGRPGYFPPIFILAVLPRRRYFEYPPALEQLSIQLGSHSRQRLPLVTAGLRHD